MLHCAIFFEWLAPSLLEMWDYRAERSRELTANDRSSIYGGVHLYVRRD